MAEPAYNLVSVGSRSKSASAAYKGTINFVLDPITLRSYLKTIGSLDKEIQNEIRDNSQRLSLKIRDALYLRAQRSPTPQAKLVAESMTTPRDRLPTVKIGGSKKVGRPYKQLGTGKIIKAPAGALLYGSEYGSHGGKDRAGRNQGDRFKAPRTKLGYWINPASDSMAREVFTEWVEYVDRIIKREGLD